MAGEAYVDSYKVRGNICSIFRVVHQLLPFGWVYASWPAGKMAGEAYVDSYKVRSGGA